MAIREGSAGVTASIPARGILPRYPLFLFFGMAYVFTWVAVSPMILNRVGVIRLDLPVELIQIVGALAGPALAGVIVTAGTEGWAGVGRLLRRVIQWKVGIVWYLVLLLGPLVVLTLTASAFLGMSFLRDFLDGLPLLLAQYLPFVLVGVIFGPLWEEIGWRGVALPRLQRTLGPVMGTLVLGSLWAAWHLPGYVGGWLGSFTLSSFLALIVGGIGFSVLMTWIFNNTSGSLLIMFLLHSASNASIAFGGQFLPSTMTAAVRPVIEGGWIPAVTYTICAIVVLLLTRGRLSYAGE